MNQPPNAKVFTAGDFPPPPPPPTRTFWRVGSFYEEETKQSIEAGIRWEAAMQEWQRIFAAVFGPNSHYLNKP